MDSFAVYGLHLGDGAFRYVGYTSKGVETRLRGHRLASRSTATQPVNRWMRKVGPDRVVARTLCGALTADDVRLAEIWWIAELRSLGYDLLNCTRGGDGVVDPDEATRERMGRGMRGKPLHPNVRAALLEANIGRSRKHSAATKAKIGALARGRPPTDVDRARKSAANRGLVGDDAYLSVLEEWLRCDDCGQRWSARSMAPHVENGTCERIVFCSTTSPTRKVGPCKSA